MDLESRRLWEQYTKVKETMLERTHIPEAPWWIVAADEKKKARLNCRSESTTRIICEIQYLRNCLCLSCIDFGQGLHYGCDGCLSWVLAPNGEILFFVWTSHIGVVNAENALAQSAKEK
jgi:hypothetical protein